MLWPHSKALWKPYPKPKRRIGVADIGVMPIRKEVVVEASQQRAFEVFTSQFAAWWPTDHHIGKQPYATSVIEPRVGGRWFEIATDGSQCDWGRVLAWEPPARLVLSWNIGTNWQFNPLMSMASELEIRFLPVDSSRTRVEFEHRHLERHGEGWQPLHTMLDNGWVGVLQKYQAYTDGAR
jgi:uncharacterized protein YndB with AHSA1/START domain